MQSVPSRAGGAIPRLFVYALGVLVSACFLLNASTLRAADLGFDTRFDAAGDDAIDEYPEPNLGRASFYGPGFAGRKTASGAIFRPEQLTAAHRFLPLGTRVRVTNLHNGESVLVTINDRGPYIRGRHIDLSVGAARAIGMLGRGVAEVLIQVL